jgi:chromosome segregation ATPase
MFARPAYWWAAGGALAVVVTSLGIGTTWSYLKTAWRSVGDTIRGATPVTFELQRLDTMVRELQPEIRQSARVVAQLEVEVEDLEKEIGILRSEQEQLFAQMRKLREELGSNKSEFEFAGQRFSRAEVERDLSRRLDVYEERQVVLAAKEELLEQKRRTLEAARSKVMEYRRAYDQLVAKQQSLKAQLAMLESAAAVGKVEIDSTKLAEAQRLAKEIEQRLRVTQRVLDADRVPEGEIPLEEVSPKSAAERFDQLFRSQNTGQTGPET